MLLVKELIEQLQKCNPELPVIIDGGETGEYESRATRAATSAGDGYANHAIIVCDVADEHQDKINVAVISCEQFDYDLIKDTLKIESFTER